MAVYEVYQRLSHSHDPVDDQVILDHEIRDKGRFKVISAKGIEVRVFLERGKTLAVGEILKTECGKFLEVVGAQEAVIEANCEDWQIFSKACYHLGNRHVKLQVGDRWLRIKPDTVLEEMLTLLGLSLTPKNTVFTPESGAYASGYHHHH